MLHANSFSEKILRDKNVVKRKISHIGLLITLFIGNEQLYEIYNLRGLKSKEDSDSENLQ